MYNLKNHLEKKLTQSLWKAVLEDKYQQRQTYSRGNAIKSAGLRLLDTLNTLL